jgi:hypothetical protein
MHSIEVLDPSGTIEISNFYAPRLTSLNGRTICMLSNHGWESDTMFPIIRNLLQKRYPDVRIIPPGEFPGLMNIEPEVIPKLLKEKGCDGVIIGNAA